MTKIISCIPIPEDLLTLLTDIGAEVEFFEHKIFQTPELLYPHMADATAIIGGNYPITHELVTAAPQLKSAATSSAGYDKFNIPALTRAGVIATNAARELNATSADLAVGLLLATARRISELDSWLRRGNWQEEYSLDLMGSDVHHKTVGIFGLGSIGYQIAQRSYAGFNMPIIYTNRSHNRLAEQHFAAVKVSKDILLREADFIVLSMPLSSETYHYIDAEAFRLMKSSAVVINIGRGALIDEAALIQALERKQIAGAGLDVFESEPYISGPLLHFPQVVLTPHIASATLATRYAMVKRAVLNTIEVLQGRVPSDILNPEVLILEK